MRLDRIPGVTIKSYLIEFTIKSKKHPELTRNYQLPVYTDVEDAISFTHNVNHKKVTITKVSKKLVEAEGGKDKFTLIFK